MRARADPGPGAKITDLAGDEPIVTDYLWDEVLGKQPPQTRMFLLRTSIAGPVSGDLADALTGQSGSARTLDRLSRENSFVEITDRERGEYAYHPLLREVLAAELNREIPHEIPVLLRRAARWYAAHDQPLASVRCAAEAEDWDYAAQILAEAGAGVATPGCTAQLESVLSLFPADRSADDPAVAAAWAAARLWDGDHEGAAAYLDSGDRALGQAAPGDAPDHGAHAGRAPGDAGRRPDRSRPRAARGGPVAGRAGPGRRPPPSPSTGPWGCCGSPLAWPGCAAGRSGRPGRRCARPTGSWPRAT